MVLPDQVVEHFSSASCEPVAVRLGQVVAISGLKSKVAKAVFPVSSRGGKVISRSCSSLAQDSTESTILDVAVGLPVPALAEPTRDQVCMTASARRPGAFRQAERKEVENARRKAIIAVLSRYYLIKWKENVSTYSFWIR
jgi:hypothetical protein